VLINCDSTNRLAARLLESLSLLYYLHCGIVYLYNIATLQNI